MIITLRINCASCDEYITKEINHLGADEPVVDVMQFEQTDWICPACGRTSVIGDIFVNDLDEVL